MILSYSHRGGLKTVRATFSARRSIFKNECWYTRKVCGRRRFLGLDGSQAQVTGDGMNYRAGLKSQRIVGIEEKFAV